MPKLITPTCQSETRKKSVKYKSSVAWNELPKFWNMNDTPLPKFKKQIHDHIVNKNKPIYIQF